MVEKFSFETMLYKRLPPIQDGEVQRVEILGKEFRYMKLEPDRRLPFQTFRCVIIFRGKIYHPINIPLGPLNGIFGNWFIRYANDGTIQWGDRASYSSFRTYLKFMYVQGIRARAWRWFGIELPYPWETEARVVLKEKEN